MKPIEQMNEAELIAYGRWANDVKSRIELWIREKHWTADKVGQYYLTKCIQDLPLLEQAIKKARALYRTKFRP